MLKTVLKTATVLRCAHSSQLVSSPLCLSSASPATACRAAATDPCRSDTRLQVHQDNGACSCQVCAGQGSGPICCCAPCCQDHDAVLWKWVLICHHWTALQAHLLLTAMSDDEQCKLIVVCVCWLCQASSAAYMSFVELGFCGVDGTAERCACIHAAQGCVSTCAAVKFCASFSVSSKCISWPCLHTMS